MASHTALDPEAEMQWIDSASLESVQFHPTTDTIESIHNIAICFIPVRLLQRFCAKFKISGNKNQSQMHTIQLIWYNLWLFCGGQGRRVVDHPLDFLTRHLLGNQLNGVHLTLVLVI